MNETPDVSTDVAKPPIEIRLAGLTVMQSRHPEILLEGPAGTGKTFFLVWYVHHLCELFPGIHVYFVRQTRKSLNQSAMALYEELLSHRHPVLTPTRARSGRDEYVYPYAERYVDAGDGLGPRWFRGISKIYLHGMDKPDRLMSTEGDIGIFFEATEGFIDGWDKLGTRLRHGHAPWNFRVADCNPSHAAHWLNQRANEPLEIDADVRAQLGDQWAPTTKIQRVKSSLKDNPKYWRIKPDGGGEYTPIGLDYKIKLASLSPTNRKRLDDGLWTDSQGQIYGNWKHDRHLVRGELVNQRGHWHLVPTLLDDDAPADFVEFRIAFFTMSTDYGFHPDPGVVQLWAHDEGGHSFLVAEHYETRVAREEWASRIAGMQAQYDVRAILCEHDPEMLRLVNELIGPKGAGGKGVAQNANKSIKAGIDVCRMELGDAPDGLPRVRFLTNALIREDLTLREEMRATCTIDEIPNYSFRPRVETRAYRTDEPDPTCDDHGLDAWRYRAMYTWRHKHKARQEPSAFKPGTLGEKFKIKERFRRDKLKRLRG